MSDRSSALRAALRDEGYPRPYPKLERRKRRAIRRIFLYGLLHPDAMHHAIWGVNTTTTGAGCRPAAPPEDASNHSG